MATYHLRTDYGARQDRRCVRAGHGLFGVWWAVRRLLQGHRVLAVPLWRRWKRGAVDGGGNDD
jgi:hypothetical protein